MRGKIKKGIALVLSAVLTVATCITTIPQLSETAFAAETEKNIQLGAAVLSHNVSFSSAATVYYDSNSDTWRVIGYDGAGVASSSGTLTLIASGNMDYGYFDSSPPYSNNYSESNLQSMIETLAADRLSPEERAAVATRTFAGESGNYGHTGYAENEISGSAVSDAVMWPLSGEEATAMNPNLRKANPEDEGSASSYWWLRSPGDTDIYAEYVYGNGTVDYYGSPVEDESGVRPAFNLKLSSIIFTSDASDIKSSGAAGTLRAPESHSMANWKLTVASSSLAAALSGTITRSGSTITVPFTVSGDHNRISVFISDREWNASGAVLKYYGALNTSGSSGTFTLPDDYDTSWKVYILAEKINGNTVTDYASTPAEITIPGASGGGGSAPGPGPSPSPAPSETPVGNNYNETIAETNSQLEAMAEKLEKGEKVENATVYLTVGDSLPLSIMKTLKACPGVTLDFRCTYKGEKLHFVLKGGEELVINENIPWYGPMCLKSAYGVAGEDKNAGEKQTATEKYVIQRGDTLYRIARQLGTSLSEILGKNPQIKDPNRIWTGQLLNY